MEYSIHDRKYSIHEDTDRKYSVHSAYWYLSPYLPPSSIIHILYDNTKQQVAVSDKPQHNKYKVDLKWKK